MNGRCPAKYKRSDGKDKAAHGIHTKQTAAQFDTDQIQKDIARLKLEEHIGEGHTDEEFKVGKGVPTVTTHLLTSAEQQGGRKEEKASYKNSYKQRVKLFQIVGRALGGMQSQIKCLIIGS